MPDFKPEDGSKVLCVTLAKGGAFLDPTSLLLAGILMWMAPSELLLWIVRYQSSVETVRAPGWKEPTLALFVERKNVFCLTELLPEP